MLDDLYGPGSWHAMQHCFVGSAGTTREFEQVEIPEGGVRVYCRWKDASGAVVGEAKIDCWADRAHFLTLWSSTPRDRKAIVTTLAGRIGDLFELVGVPRVTISPLDDVAAAIFERTGAVRDEDGRWAYITSGTGQRRKAYVAWKAGYLPEPDWHAGL